MIYYLYTILKLVLFNIIILKIVIILFFILSIKYLRHYLSSNVVTIEKMRINFMFFYVLNTVLFILFYVCLLGYWRFLNTNRTLDLKLYIYHIYYFILCNNKYDTILLFICIIFALILLYYIINMLKKYFIYHFLKLSIFLTYFSQYEDYYETTNYDKFTRKLLKMTSFFSYNLSYKFIKYLCKLYIKYYKLEYKENDDRFLLNFTLNIRNKLNIPQHEQRFPFYLIIFSLTYDIIYHNMILNKLYYISFILFFYYLLQKIKNIICTLYKGDSIFIYNYLYEKKELNDWQKEEIQAKILHINNCLFKAVDSGKITYPIDYDEKRLLKLSWSTYLLFLNIFIIIYIFYIRDTEIIIHTQSINNIVIVSIISVYMILWFFVKNLIIENIFLMINVIIIVIWLIILINHKIPLLFHNILLETSYFKIMNNYTVYENLHFIKEYFMLKTKHLSINDKIYLLKIFKSIPFYDLLHNATIDEIKNYIDNLIKVYEHMENNIYPSLKDKVCMEKNPESVVDSISTFIIIGLISLMYYIYIL